MTIRIHKLRNAWTKIYIDERFTGELEDAEDTVEGTIRNIIKSLRRESVEIIVVDDRK